MEWSFLLNKKKRLSCLHIIIFFLLSGRESEEDAVVNVEVFLQGTRHGGVDVARAVQGQVLHDNRDFLTDFPRAVK